MDFSLEDREKMMEREMAKRCVSPTCTHSHPFLDQAATPKRLFDQGVVSERGIEGSEGPYIQTTLRVMAPNEDFEENLMEGREL